MTLLQLLFLVVKCLVLPIFNLRLVIFIIFCRYSTLSFPSPPNPLLGKAKHINHLIYIFQIFNLIFYLYPTYGYTHIYIHMDAYLRFFEISSFWWFCLMTHGLLLCVLFCILFLSSYSMVFCDAGIPSFMQSFPILKVLKDIHLDSRGFCRHSCLASDRETISIFVHMSD